MYTLIGYCYVIVAASLWALIGPLAKFAFAEGMTPLEVAFWRAVFGAAFFWIHVRRKQPPKAGIRDIPVFLAFGVVGIALFFGSYQLAVEGAGAAVASILLYTAPAWVAILSWLLFKEPLPRKTLIALVMAMTGAALVCLSGATAGTVTLAGIAFGLLSGFTYSLHYVFGKKYLSRYSSATLYAWCLPAGALCILPFVTFVRPTLISTAVVCALGLFCTYGAYYTYCKGLERLQTTHVAIVANAEPVLAAILAWMWWNETFTVTGYAGAVMVLCAVLLIATTRNATSCHENGSTDNAETPSDPQNTSTADTFSEQQA